MFKFLKKLTGPVYTGNYSKNLNLNIFYEPW